MNFRYSLHWISEARNALMGIAIISVLIQHSLSWAHIAVEKFPFNIISSLFLLIFTGGFLFLSGYGMYFSLSRNSDLCCFYRKRFFRVVIPFLIMATPFYTVMFLSGDLSYIDFVLFETTFYNIFKTNNGMWYITASIMMYTITPCLYRIINSPYNRHGLFEVALVALFLFLAFFIQQYSPEYSSKTSILWNQIPIFIIGIIAGKIAISRTGGVNS